MNKSPKAETKKNETVRVMQPDEFWYEGTHHDKVLSVDNIFEIVESADQRIYFRVGPVFGENGQHETPGVWIWYQEEYMKGNGHDLLISPEVFDHLIRWYKGQRRRSTWWYRYLVRPIRRRWMASQYKKSQL